MLVKPKQNEKWRRRGRRGHAADRQTVSVEVAGPSSHENGPQPGHSSRVNGASPRDRRHGGPSEDRALYSCECGFVFEALVTTSVGCPRCGNTQAW